MIKINKASIDQSRLYDPAQLMTVSWEAAISGYTVYMYSRRKAYSQQRNVFAGNVRCALSQHQVYTLMTSPLTTAATYVLSKNIDLLWCLAL